MAHFRIKLSKGDYLNLRFRSGAMHHAGKMLSEFLIPFNLIYCSDDGSWSRFSVAFPHFQTTLNEKCPKMTGSLQDYPGLAILFLDMMTIFWHARQH